MKTSAPPPEMKAAARWFRRSWPSLMLIATLIAFAAAQAYIIVQLHEVRELANAAQPIGTDFDTPLARQAAEGARDYSRQALDEARGAREMAGMAAASSARVEERLQYR